MSNHNILQLPSFHIIAGKSQSGKTWYVIDLLKKLKKKKFHNPFTLPNGKILWIQQSDVPDEVKIEQLRDELNNKKKGEYSMAILKTKDIEEEKDEINEWIDENYTNGLNSLLVLDNLGFNTDKSKFLTELFTFGRHKKVSVFNIIHELFSYRQLKTQRALADYFHLFFLGGKDVENCIEQIYGKDDYRHGMSLYRKAQQKPYGHLVIDLSARPADIERWKNKERINHFLPVDLGDVGAK